MSSDDAPAGRPLHDRAGDPRVRPRPVGDAGPAESVTVAVDLPAVTTVLWIVTAALVVLDFVASVAAATRLLPYALTRFFDGDSKVNFPTGEKTTLLLTASLLMLLCWTAGRRRQDEAASGWLLLALVTGYAFVDETIYLHQTLSTAMTDKLHLTGVLKYSWTAVYVPAALLVGIFLLRNLRLMAAPVRRRLLPGGAIYVAGAMLLEPVKGHLADTRGDDSLAFKLAAAVSDSLELVGLTLLVIAMLVAVRTLGRGFLFVLRADGEPPALRSGAPAVPRRQPAGPDVVR
jgi:hypothetical protein